MLRARWSSQVASLKNAPQLAAVLPAGRRRRSFNFDASIRIELLPGPPEQTSLF